MGADDDEAGVDLIGGSQDALDSTPLDAAPLPHEIVKTLERRAPFIDHHRVHLSLPLLDSRSPVAERSDQSVGVDDDQFGTESDGEVGSEQQAPLRFIRAVDADDDRGGADRRSCHTIIVTGPRRDRQSRSTLLRNGAIR